MGWYILKFPTGMPNPMRDEKEGTGRGEKGRHR